MSLDLLDPAVWNDLLALAGIATICDVVPLNPVNHKIAKMGVDALLRSSRRVFVDLRKACALAEGLDEKDIGFRIGPRINAVGRLKHARYVVEAFLEDDPRALIELWKSAMRKGEIYKVRSSKRLLRQQALSYETLSFFSVRSGIQGWWELLQVR